MRPDRRRAGRRGRIDSRTGIKKKQRHEGAARVVCVSRAVTVKRDRPALPSDQAGNANRVTASRSDSA